MGTPLRIKRSAVPGKVPAVQDLQLGELALNTYDAELYTLRYRPGIGTEVVKIGGASVANILYVNKNGDDDNTGLTLADAKATIKGAVGIASEGTTIKVASGSYVEDNPIKVPKQISIVGGSLREVSIIPQNANHDLFHVSPGVLISDVSFTGTVDVGKAIVAFDPDKIQYSTQSPYILNSTNFVTNSIGMKIDGNHQIGPFKSMVTDSFTQYNQNGVGCSITNEGYAQIVSMFTINSDTAVFTASGGQCDLTNSNSSFGNFGLVADGVGDIEFTGSTNTAINGESDAVIIDQIKDIDNNYRTPFDGKGAYFHLDMSDYNDTASTAQITQPMQLVRSIKITNAGSPGDYSPSSPPIVTASLPEGPEAIFAEFSPNVAADGTLESVDVIASGRNFLPTQTVTISISGSGSAIAEANMDPIYFTISESTDSANSGTGTGTVTFNEFIPYPVKSGVTVEFVRLSRIITSSHSFEYIGAGTDLNTANPFQGGKPIPENEVVAINGGQVPFTSTDQKGNFRIGDGLTIDQTTSTIRGRDFNRAIQAQLTPLILALK